MEKKRRRIRRVGRAFHQSPFPGFHLTDRTGRVLRAARDGVGRRRRPAPTNRAARGTATGRRSSTAARATRPSATLARTCGTRRPATSAGTSPRRSTTAARCSLRTPPSCRDAAATVSAASKTPTPGSTQYAVRRSTFHSFILFVRTAIKKLCKINSRTGQQGTEVYFNCPHIVLTFVTIEPKVARKVYTFNSTFKTASEFKSTIFGNELQTFTTHSDDSLKIVANTQVLRYIKRLHLCPRVGLYRVRQKSNALRFFVGFFVAWNFEAKFYGHI